MVWFYFNKKVHFVLSEALNDDANLPIKIKFSKETSCVCMSKCQDNEGKNKQRRVKVLKVGNFTKTTTKPLSDSEAASGSQW